MKKTLGWLALGFVYTMILLAVAKKSFSLIYHVPDRVMAWIGDNSPGVGAADEGISQVNQGVDKGANSTSGVASSVGQFVGYGGSDLVSNRLGQAFTATTGQLPPWVHTRQQQAGANAAQGQGQQAGRGQDIQLERDD